MRLVLDLVTSGEVKVLAHIDRAELVQRYGEDDETVIAYEIDEFMQIHPHALYSPFLNGQPLGGNFLLTEKPIESWLPDYLDAGLWYVTDPSRIELSNTYLLKDELVKFDVVSTTERHNDKVQIHNWLEATIGGKRREIPDRASRVLKRLYESPTHLGMASLAEENEKPFTMDSVIKRKGF